MKVIDRKFQIQAVNPVNGKRYTEVDALLLCAKDKAVPAALQAYKYKCLELGANPEHIKSIELLVERVLCFQEDQGGGRVPDTIGAEIPRCINGEGVGVKATVMDTFLVHAVWEFEGSLPLVAFTTLEGAVAFAAECDAYQSTEPDDDEDQTEWENGHPAKPYLSHGDTLGGVQSFTWTELTLRG